MAGAERRTPQDARTREWHLSGRHTASGRTETQPATTRGRHRRTAPVTTVRPGTAVPRVGRVGLVLSTVVSAAGGLLAGPALAAGEAPAASRQSTEDNPVARGAHAEAAVPGTERTTPQDARTRE